MNKFVQRKSLLAVGLMYFCIMALFADGSNLSDLFSNCRTIHFEEGDGTNLGIEAGSLPSNGLPSFEFFNTLQTKTVAAKRPSTISHVILDQDSPFLEACSISNTITSFISPEEKKLPTYHVYLTESLYLQDCSLLI